jgi:two-component system LytT family sensor kinase
MSRVIVGAVMETFSGEHPLTRGYRPFVIAAAWLAFHLLQAATLGATDPQPDRIRQLLLLYGAIGVAWAALTFFVGVRLLPDGGDRWGPRVLRHAIGLLICGLLDTLVRRIASTMLGATPVIPWYGTLLYFADRTAVGYLAIVLLARTLAAHDRFIARQQQSLSLQAELARARLASLEEQLHPHFLFNCLGAVSELAHEAPAAAARMLRQLASVLRFAVERRGSEVTVAEEVAALEPYLEVQRTRFPDWLRIETRVDPGAADLLMPPLVLQPLVENAIRHGLVRRDSAGVIVVSGTVRDDELVLEVRDNGVGLRGDHLSGRGIGTGNLRERLATLYGEDGRLMVFEDAAGGVVSQVSIPAHRPQHAEDLAAKDADGFLSNAFRRWPVASVAGAWAVWGLLWTQQSIAYLAFRGRSIAARPGCACSRTSSRPSRSRRFTSGQRSGC